MEGFKGGQMRHGHVLVPCTTSKREIFLGCYLIDCSIGGTLGWRRGHESAESSIAVYWTCFTTAAAAVVL